MSASPDRGAVLAEVAADVRALPSAAIRRIAVDGVDGAGKTVFADELAAALVEAGESVIRASVDGFHNVPAIRHRRGRDSPEGFFRDSYDYESLVSLLLAPLGPGGSGIFVPRIYDVEAEQPVPRITEEAAAQSILVLDGIFLHRDELAGFWDYSIWLEVPFEVSVRRCVERGDASGDPDPEGSSNRRYVEGQRIYLRECEPRRRSTIVIDNTELERPVLRRNAVAPAPTSAPVIVIGGPIASGKSTIGRAAALLLEQQGLAAAAIDLDLVYEMLAPGGSPKKDDPLIWSRARRAAAGLADAFFADGVDAVVVEGDFLEGFMRSEFTTALRSPVRLVFVTLHAPFAVALERAQRDPTRGLSRVAAFLRGHYEEIGAALVQVPATDLVIDTSTVSVAEAARTIVERVLPVLADA